MDRRDARGGGWDQTNAKPRSDAYTPRPSQVVDTRYIYKPGQQVEITDGPRKGKRATVFCLTVGYDAMDGFDGPAYQVESGGTFLVRWDWVVASPDEQTLDNQD